ncbi:MAG: hypothetical protein ACRC9L_03720 [Brevinema sp.]
MIPNKLYFRETLIARLDISPKLIETPQTCIYLPEILLRTLRDSFRLITGDFASAGALELCEQLNLTLSDSLKQEILIWEDALRTPQKYAELVPSPSLILEFSAALKQSLLT